MLGKQRTSSKLLIPGKFLTSHSVYLQESNQRGRGKAWSYDSAHVVFWLWGFFFAVFVGSFVFSFFKSECLHCTCGLEGLDNVLLPVSSTREMWCLMRKMLGLSDMGCWVCFAAFSVCLAVGKLSPPRLACGHKECDLSLCWPW